MLPGGISTAPDCSCAIECPACPHPESRPAELSHSESTDEDSEAGYMPFFIIFNTTKYLTMFSRWVDAQFTMIDANFRLKLKD